ncbi:MAG: VWA domain-containing protein [Acidobacteriota bacterium]
MRARTKMTARDTRLPGLAWLLAASVACATLFALWTLSPARMWGQQDPAGASGAKPATSERGSASGAPSGSNTTGGNNKIKVHVEVVNVPVTVLDKRGIPVIDLSKKDFQVYENGKLQTISYFSSETMPPLRIGLIVDTSNSARFYLKFEKDAAAEFAFSMLKGLHSQNQVFLETFDSSSHLLQDFTNDPDDINDKLRHLKAGGGKAVYDAIYDACKHEIMKAGPREQTRRVLVVISDGIDIQSKHSLDEAISMAHRAETAIYTIGNTPYGFADPGSKYLEKLAEDTGGGAFFPERKSPGTGYLTGYLSHGQFDSLEQNRGLDAETGIYHAKQMIALADSLDAIRRQLTNQYVIGYMPTDSKLDGTYRKIRVAAQLKGVTIRYKPGYFATAGQ